MKKTILFTSIITIILFTISLSGCSSGIAQDIYDNVVKQMQDAQAKAAEAQNKISDIQAAASAKEKELQAKINELQSQVGGIKEQATIIGSSTEETAKKLVKAYKETHTYSKIDMFTCSDFSAEVWNMLKTQGINAFIAIGSTKTGLTDILQSDHAWVMAEISPGKYLALETTAGVAIPKTQNAFYYRGWKFASPQSIKDNNDMVKEYNVRVGIRNQINNEANAVAALHKQSTNPAEADKLEAVFNKLIEIRTGLETELTKLKAEIDSLAQPFTA